MIDRVNWGTLECKTVAFLQTRATRAVFERKVWSKCRNGEESWGDSNYGRVRLARFAREDFGYGEEKTTVSQSRDTLKYLPITQFDAGPTSSAPTWCLIRSLFNRLCSPSRACRHKHVTVTETFLIPTWFIRKASLSDHLTKAKWRFLKTKKLLFKI